MNGAVQNETEKRRWCHVCTKNGRKSKLQYFQINFEEAILLCPDKECTYPLDSEPLEKLLIKRKAEDLANSLKRKRRRIELNQPRDNVLSSSGTSAAEVKMVSGNSISSNLPALNNEFLLGSVTYVNCNSMPAMISSHLDPGSFLNKTASRYSDETFSPSFMTVTNPPQLLTNGCLDHLPINSESVSNLASHGTHFLGDDLCDYASTNSLSNTLWSDLMNGDTLFEAPMPNNPGTVLFNPLFQDFKTESPGPVNSVSCLLTFDDTRISSTASEEIPNDIRRKVSNSDGIDSFSVANGDCNFFKQDVLDFSKLPHSSTENLNRTNCDEAEAQKVCSPEDLNTASIELDALHLEDTSKVDSCKQSDSGDIKSEADLGHRAENSVNHLKQECTSNLKKKSFTVSRSKEHEEKALKEPNDSKNDEELPAVTEDVKPIIPREVGLKFLQWTNKDSLCWLDVVMCLLTHNKTLKISLNESIKDSCLKQLVASYGIAQTLFRQGLELRRCELLCRMGRTVRLETTIGDIMVKTDGVNSADILFGAKSIVTIAMDEFEAIGVDQSFDVRNIFSREEPNSVSIEKMSQEANRLDELSKKTLFDARDRVFSFLEPSLRCKKGQNDSPLIALTSILSKDSAGKDVTLEYCWDLTCLACQAVHKDSVKREVLTFLKLPDDFKMSEPRFLRNCLSCKEPNQQLHIHFERLPDVFFHHFLEGIHPCRVSDLDFEFKGDKYAVTGLVQYKTDPDHFVSWLREPIGK